MTNESELREDLAKRLSRDEVSDTLWEVLKFGNHVQEAIDFGESGTHDLVEAARALSGYEELMESVTPTANREGVGDTSKEHPRAPKVDDRELQIDARESGWMAALGEYVAFRASLHPLVQRFREEVLVGYPLTSQQAQAFIDSPANSRFSSDYLIENGVPTDSHSARFVDHGVAFEDEKGEKFIEVEYVYVDPPGEVFTALLPPSIAYEDLETASFPASVETTPSTIRVGTAVSEAVHYVPVYPNSVLDDLWQLSRRLSKDFCGAWDETQVVWFVLTGETVLPRTRRGSYHGDASQYLAHGTIVLEVEPWVPAQAVVDLYQLVQSNVLGQKPRSPSPRNLEVFRFVMKELRSSLARTDGPQGTAEPPPWIELMRLWNKEHANKLSWTYRHPSKFHRDYRRGGQAVADPYDYDELSFSRTAWSVP